MSSVRVREALINKNDKSKERKKKITISMAGKNQILVCKDTFREIRHLVSARKIALPLLKGMELRIDVYKIINAS